MMARQTYKYRVAMAYIRDNSLKIKRTENTKVYEALEAQNIFWNAKSGAWEKKEHAPSTSVFEADDGTPTGIVKIRVMAHPDDLEQAIKALKLCSGFRVIEISEKSYPNRKGSGYRIYTTVIMDGGAS